MFNRPYADALKRQIDMETEDRKTLASAGFGGLMADLFASAVDSTNLIPGGAAVKSIRTGKAVLGTARSTAVAGALAASVSEVALQSTQETRTVGESVLAIGGGAVLAGVLGPMHPLSAASKAAPPQSSEQGVHPPLL